MVRAILLVAFLGCGLFADTLQQSVKKMIGPHAYSKNRLILNTVFSHKERFYTGGRLDYVKIAQVLKRLGFLPERYSQPKTQRIAFDSFAATPLFVKLSMETMERGGVFDYAIARAQKDEEGMGMAYLFRSRNAFDVTQALKFLEGRGVKVLGVERAQGGWRLFCDATQARLTSKRSAQIERVDEPIWINVAGKSRVVLSPNPKNHWHPLVVLYDKELCPLRLIEIPERKRKLEITLPKGCYYIKISDKFTIRNLKHGLRVSAI